MSPATSSGGAPRALLVRYCVAAGLVRLADEMVPVAVVLLALARTARPALAGALVAAYTLPAVLSGPLLGAWLDHTRHVRLALAGNAGLLVVATLGLSAGVGRWPPALAVALAALAGCSLPLTSAGFTSMVPRLVPRESLAHANAIDATTFNAAAIGGPALAGSIAAFAGAGVATAVIAAAALLGLVATLLLPLRSAFFAGGVARSDDPRRVAEDARAGVRTRADTPTLLATLRAGIGQVLRRPALRGATATSVAAHGALGVLAVALPLLARDLGAREEAAGWLWAALELGALLGTLALLRRLGAAPAQRVVFAGTAAFGVVLASLALAPSLAVAMAVLVAAGFVHGPVLPSLFAVRQGAPAELLSQVSMTGVSLKVAAFAIGSLIGGWLAPRTGAARTIVLVAAAQVAAAALGALLARHRAARAAATPPAAASPC